VGYSAFVDNSVIKSTQEAGFDLVIETPLTVSKIKELVLETLQQRAEKSLINQLNSGRSPKVAE